MDVVGTSLRLAPRKPMPVSPLHHLDLSCLRTSTLICKRCRKQKREYVHVAQVRRARVGKLTAAASGMLDPSSSTTIGGTSWLGPSFSKMFSGFKSPWTGAPPEVQEVSQSLLLTGMASEVCICGTAHIFLLKVLVRAPKSKSEKCRHQRICRCSSTDINVTAGAKRRNTIFLP